MTERILRAAARSVVIAVAYKPADFNSARIFIVLDFGKIFIGIGVVRRRELARRVRHAEQNFRQRLVRVFAVERSYKRRGHIVVEARVYLAIGRDDRNHVFIFLCKRVGERKPVCGKLYPLGITELFLTLFIEPEKKQNHVRRLCNRAGFRQKSFVSVARKTVTARRAHNLNALVAAVRGKEFRKTAVESGVADNRDFFAL